MYTWQDWLDIYGACIYHKVKTIKRGGCKWMMGLKRIRKRAGMTQKQLAEALHVDTNTVARWERGVILPKVDRLQEIASYFGVTIDELVNPPKEE
jgi:DNA-binding XRE family transcriptional regulator